MKNYSISVVIPSFNEQQYLPLTVSTIHSLLSSNFLDFEIIVIDDGSSDNSYAVLVDLQKQYPCLNVIKNLHNAGIGVSLRRGFLAATKELIFYIDCDLPFSPEFLIRAVEFLNDYDIVIGRRNSWDNSLRKFSSFVYNRIAQLLFDVDIVDLNVGIKVFKRILLSAINLTASSSFLSAELILEAKDKNFRIKQLPCVYSKRIYGVSKMGTINNISKAFMEMIRYYFRRRVFCAKLGKNK